MHLTDLHVDRFGVLSDFSLNRLSPGITVFWGSNGCGKSTVVQFLRSLLFGFRSCGPNWENRQGSEGGWVRWRTSAGTRMLSRSRHVLGDESCRLSDADDRPVVLQNSGLPAWVNDEVFRDVFSVGWEEADRFDLLTRLCLESGTTRASMDAEIRAAEMALQEAASERDGNGVQPGLLQRIGELRRRQQDLLRELNSLHRPVGDLPEKIQQLVRDIDEMTQVIERIDVRRAELDREIGQLERQRDEQRRRHVLPMDRVAIEARIRTAMGRLEHWQNIRGQMTRDTEGVSTEAAHPMRPAEALLAIRTLVTRLEDRVQELVSGTGAAAGRTPDRVVDDAAVRQLQLETAALCRSLARHELAVGRHEQSLEHAAAQRCLQDVMQMEQLLQERLAGLRAELQRADDVLAVTIGTATTVDVSTAAACRHRIHSGQELTTGVGGSRWSSADEAERELQRLRSERTRLVAERGVQEELRHTRRAVLERVRQELTSAATLEQLDSLRAQIAELDAQAVLLEDRRWQLEQSEVSLREVIERLRQRTHSRVLELASAYVRRLTEGECSEILAGRSGAPGGPATLLMQTTHQAEPLTLAQLSRGTRHQAGLALRLALISIRREAGVHVPLILDDVFITSDDARATAVVQLLTELAAAGQQILFFTCQRDVRDLFLRFHADVRAFSGQPYAGDAGPVLKAYVEETRTAVLAEVSTPVALPVMQEPVVSSPMPVSPPIVPPAPAMESPPQPNPQTPDRPANWLFYLEVDQDVDDLAGISLGELEAFRAAGIRTVDDVLQQSTEQLEQLTRAHGYVMASERLQALRGQAELTCRVPMLRRSDAALLYAAGIRTVEDLAALRPETVYDRIVSFQKTDAGSRFRRAGRLIDRQQAINWARWGQHARSLQDARTTPSRFSVRGQAPVRPDRTEPEGSRRQQRRDRIRSTGSLSRRRPLVAETGDAAQRRARRLARRRRLASRLRTSAPDGSSQHHRDAQSAEHPVAVTTVAGRNLRFFLSRSSDVDSAPSIGPKTAESLDGLGVRTVDDLLTVSAERLAQQLNHRRITAGVVRQWQAQARLMCQVPELRGHDVQLLVACGISDPEDLARRKPADLLAIIAPFADSREGERILRNGPKPDLAEVTDWIAWATSARAFRAA